MYIKFRGLIRRGGWWVVAQFALFALILVALTRNRDTGVFLQITGWSAIMLGLALGGSGLWLLRQRITALPAPREGAVLVDRGPYALARHPIYGGVILGFLGLAVKGGNVVALLLSLTLIPFFRAKTEYEEQMLLARFPEYEAYRSRVRWRMLPWLL